MPWSGDISRMGHLADRVADLASVPARASRAASEGIQAEMVGEFAAGEDPYGDAWEQLADSTIDKGRTNPPLTDTTKMVRSLSVRPMAGAGIQITIDHPAAPHQTGWSGPRGDGPSRPILPARGELPERWQQIIEGAVTNEVRGRRRA